MPPDSGKDMFSVLWGYVWTFFVWMFSLKSPSESDFVAWILIWIATLLPLATFAFRKLKRLFH